MNKIRELIDIRDNEYIVSAARHKAALDLNRVIYECSPEIADLIDAARGFAALDSDDTWANTKRALEALDKKLNV